MMEGFQTAGIIVLASSQALCLFLLLGLARELGIIHIRMGPTYGKAAHVGPQVGQTVEAFDVEDIRGSRPKRVGITKHEAKLLLLTSPTCPACGELLGSLTAFARGYRGRIAIFILSSGARSPADLEYAAKIPSFVTYSCGHQSAHERFDVSLTPYAILLDADNAVTAVGIVNNLQQLEALVAVEQYSETRHLRHHSASANGGRIDGGVPALGAAGRGLIEVEEPKR